MVEVIKTHNINFFKWIIFFDIMNEQNLIFSPGGVVEWFKALVLKAKNTYIICNRSERYLKKWPPIGGLVVLELNIKVRIFEF